LPRRWPAGGVNGQERSRPRCGSRAWLVM
jgi:hypothetical protein